jgi:hypothetical protein
MKRSIITLALVVSAGLFVGCDKKEPEAPKTGTGPSAAESSSAKAKLTEAQAATVKKYEEFVAASEKQIAALKEQASKASDTTQDKIRASLKPAEKELTKLKAALVSAKEDGVKDDSKLDELGASAKAAFEKAVKEASDFGSAAKDAANDALKSFSK